MRVLLSPTRGCGPWRHLQGILFPRSSLVLQRRATALQAFHTVQAADTHEVKTRLKLPSIVWQSRDM